MALKVDGTDEYAFLVNEKEYEKSLNTLSQVTDFLKSQYLTKPFYTHKELESYPSDRSISLNLVRNEEGKFGFTNILGELVISNKYDGACDFSEGLARVCQIINGEYFYGFINQTGDEVIPLNTNLLKILAKDMD